MGTKSNRMLTAINTLLNDNGIQWIFNICYLYQQFTIGPWIYCLKMANKQWDEVRDISSSSSMIGFCSAARANLCKFPFVAPCCENGPPKIDGIKTAVKKTRRQMSACIFINGCVLSRLAQKFRVIFEKNFARTGINSRSSRAFFSLPPLRNWVLCLQIHHIWLRYINQGNSTTEHVPNAIRNQWSDVKMVSSIINNHKNHHCHDYRWAIMRWSDFILILTWILFATSACTHPKYILSANTWMRQCEKSDQSDQPHKSTANWNWLWYGKQWK